MSVLLALLLAAAPSPMPLATPATCNASDRYPAIVAWGAPLIPSALADRYPDGAQLTATIAIDAAGRAGAIEYYPGTPEDLRSAFAAWLRAARYETGLTNCIAAAGKAQVTQTFFPPSSGVAGFPPVAGGVDFATLAFGRGPCEGSDPPERMPSVDALFAGTVSGQTLAIVVLRCDFPVGFNAEARAYRIANGSPGKLATVGTFGLPGSDSPMPATGWIHVSFAKNRLYVDTWTYGAKTWMVVTYGLRGGKLAELFAEKHQRASPLPDVGAP